MDYDAGLSRRKFLATAASAGGSVLLGSSPLRAAADAADPRLAQVKAKTVAIDMHNHIFSGAAGLSLPDPAAAPQSSLTDELKKAGLTAVVAGYKIPFDPNAKPGETYAKLLDY